MSQDKPEPKIISYSKLVPKEDFELPLLNEELLNKQVAVLDVKFGESQFGKYAVVTTDKGKYRVSSTVLISQLEIIKKALDGEYDEVLVKCKKVKNYFSFE